jgi:hypothetical protein
MKRNLIILSVLLCLVSLSDAYGQTRLRSRGSEVSIDGSSNILLKPLPLKEIRIGDRGSLTYISTPYTGTSSFQPIGIDLNLAAAAGSTDGKFLAPIMGNVFGTNLSKAGNYIGGVIGHYNIAGTNATTYPSGAVLAGIGDGTTTAKGAVVAYIDGDSAQTNAGAAFKVMHNNSTAASKFTYGLDLFDAAHDGFNAVSFGTADIRFNSQATLSLLSATASLDFAQANANTCEVLTIAVTNAADGNPISIGVPHALSNHNTTATFFAWVSSAGVVSVRRCVIDADGSNPAAGVVRATVLKP